MNWTSPGDLRKQIENLWTKGILLRSLATRTQLFPRQFTFKTPNASEMARNFDDVRTWVREVREAPYWRIETRDFNHRELGANSIPAEAWMDSFDYAIALIGKQREVAQFTALLEITAKRQPGWLPSISHKPLRALALSEDWNRFLDIAAWCLGHPRPAIYLRQIDLPGVHTKFIEKHHDILSELLDLVLPADAIDSTASGATRFPARYGFREKPARVRFRILDPKAMPGWPGEDITITADAFAKLDPPATTIFITENETNFLAFPPAPQSLILFGGGYGFKFLQGTAWLSDRHIYYWGDIDTHGFGILDQLRHRFGGTRSFLMDHETFLTHAHLWGHESDQIKRDLTKLSVQEQSLYNDLRDNRLGKNLRLEQEQIGFGWMRSAIEKLNFDYEAKLI